MSYWKIAWRNMQQRALASSLTGLSMALGVALMILVLVIHHVVVDQLSNDAQGYHLIVGGGKGSKFDVVLSTVFHFGTPLYPISYDYYKAFTTGEYAPYTEAAVPICLGDSFAAENGQNFRVVGTTPEMFDHLTYGVDDRGEPKRYRFQDGRNFRSEEFYTGVIGSLVANRTGLRVGDRFRPTHGMSAEGDKHDEFEIVGVLAPTGTANDRGLFINIEGFYLLEGHARTSKADVASPSTDDTGQEGGDKALGLRASETDVPGEKEESATNENDEPRDLGATHPRPLPESQREVTSILVLCKEDQLLAPMVVEKGINKSADGAAQAVAPARVVQQLKDSFLAPMQLILLVLTILIVLVAGVSILVSIYNSMSERSYDIAVMRALGASRNAVMSIILVESILLSLLGGLAGVLLGHAILAVASPWVEYYTGVTVGWLEFSVHEWKLIPGLVAFASLVGFLPALTAYRTDVARTLGGAR